MTPMKRLVMADATVKLEMYSEKITESGCWIWMGANTGGKFSYGIVSIKGKVMRAHRASFETYKGPIPKNMCVCHTCDIPECCNPAHLFLGSKKDNTQDMLAKKRSRHLLYMPKGEQHYRTKLTAANVIAIRKLYAEGKHSQSQIGKRFNLSQPAIFKILRRQRWGHV